MHKGEFLTLLGPSGSGKTTLLGLIAGITLPSEGRIELAGVDISRVPPERRDIGVVFQNYALFPHMTVRDNIAFPLRFRKIDRQERAAASFRPWSSYGWTISPTDILPNFPADSSSVWRWRVRSSLIRPYS